MKKIRDQLKRCLIMKGPAIIRMSWMMSVCARRKGICDDMKFFRSRVEQR